MKAREIYDNDLILQNTYLLPNFQIGNPMYEEADENAITYARRLYETDTMLLVILKTPFLPEDGGELYFETIVDFVDKEEFFANAITVQEFIDNAQFVQMGHEDMDLIAMNHKNNISIVQNPNTNFIDIKTTSFYKIPSDVYSEFSAKPNEAIEFFKLPELCSLTIEFSEIFNDYNLMNTLVNSYQSYAAYKSELESTKNLDNDAIIKELNNKIEEIKQTQPLVLIESYKEDIVEMISDPSILELIQQYNEKEDINNKIATDKKNGALSLNTEEMKELFLLQMENSVFALNTLDDLYKTDTNQFENDMVFYDKVLNAIAFTLYNFQLHYELIEKGQNAKLTLIDEAQINNNEPNNSSGMVM